MSNKEVPEELVPKEFMTMKEIKNHLKVIRSHPKITEFTGNDSLLNTLKPSDTVIWSFREWDTIFKTIVVENARRKEYGYD